MALRALSQRALLPSRPLCAGPRQPVRPSRRLVVPRASEFNLSEYQEAVIAEVQSTEKYGHVVLLRIKDTQSVLPVYIGDFECGALVKGINKKPTLRPLTHDLMRNSLKVLGARVTKVRITALVGNTYHARVHYGCDSGANVTNQALLVPEDVDLDARPSDAMNLAVRFGATIYVNKEVVAKMSHPMHIYDTDPTGSGTTEQHSDVVRSCREEIMAYNDPTILTKLQMHLAIAEERFEDAKTLRDQIDRILASDRALSLVVAMETAIDDGRYEEAARLRDEFKALRQAQQLSSSEVDDL